MNKILLIDDEVDFVESLQEFLSLDNALFTTKIALSVDDAKQLIQYESYDLIITDIRMPEKSGLELLVFLKNIEYSGEIMVMTAYGDAEINSHIKTLGSTKIIGKPINFDWFKNMLFDFFKTRGFSGTIDSIDLTTLLQVIHLEKKTTGIEIKLKNETGYLYFKDGELINAEFRGISGEEAAFKLIGLNSGHFNLVRNKRSYKTSITTPFMNFLLGVMKDVDELVEKKQKIVAVEKIALKKEILKKFKEGINYKWIVFFNDESNILLLDNRDNTKCFPYITMFRHMMESSETVLQEHILPAIDFYIIQIGETVYIGSRVVSKDIRIIIKCDINEELGKIKNIVKQIDKEIKAFII